MSNEKSFTEMIIASMVIVPRPCPNATQLGYGRSQYIARNVRMIQIFMIFTTHDHNTKFSHAFCVLVSLTLTMALYRYFNRLKMSYTLPQDIFRPLLVCVKIYSAQLNVLQAFNAPLWLKLVSINLLLAFLHRPVLGY